MHDNLRRELALLEEHLSELIVRYARLCEQLDVDDEGEGAIEVPALNLHGGFSTDYLLAYN